LVESVRMQRTKKGTNSDKEALRIIARKKEFQAPGGHRSGVDAWIETLESRLAEGKNLERQMKESEERARKLLSDAMKALSPQQSQNES
jgi:hypothetical protein